MTVNSLNLKFLEKEAKSFKVKMGVFLLLIQNDELLLLRRYNTGIADGCYVVPMGGVKEGETATQALIRETEEETSIILQPEEINVCHVMYRFHQMPEGYHFPQVDVYFKAKRWTGTITNCEPHKCDELQFYSLQSLPEKTEPFILHALECSQKGIFFSEFGW
jgi:8-oxo-dGTP diphosphatase